MDSQKTVAFILEFIQEVADFKSYIHKYYHDGVNKIIGLGNRHLFKVYIQDDNNNYGWPIMCYMKHVTNSSWLLPSRPTKLQKENAEGQLQIPTSDPKLVPLKLVWKNVQVNPLKKNIKEIVKASKNGKRGFIKNKITKFVEFWRYNLAQNRRYSIDMARMKQRSSTLDNLSLYSEATMIIGGPPTPIYLTPSAHWWPADNPLLLQYVVDMYSRVVYIHSLAARRQHIVDYNPATKYILWL